MFWHWVNERHLIYVRRQQGEPKPWTQDAVLQKYKFTNVFRQLDRGTVWLTEHWLNPTMFERHPMGLILFNICLYRHINWRGTAEELGFQTKWNPDWFIKTMRARQARAEQTYTGSHIIRGRDGMDKAESIAITMSEIWERRNQGVKMMRREKSLQTAFQWLISFDYIGDFMAYEFTSDLRWTPILSDATDIMTWANAGPGAKRGLRAIWPDIKTKEELDAMRGLLAMSKDFTHSYVPQLEMREIEHSLCEFYKYFRFINGGARPRATYPGV